jgi:hypothetical protein
MGDMVETDDMLAFDLNSDSAILDIINGFSKILAISKSHKTNDIWPLDIIANRIVNCNHPIEVRLHADIGAGKLLATAGAGAC